MVCAASSGPEPGNRISEATIPRPVTGFMRHCDTLTGALARPYTSYYIQ